MVAEDEIEFTFAALQQRRDHTDHALVNGGGEIGSRDDVHVHRRRAERNAALLHLPQPGRRRLGDGTARDEKRQQVGMLGR